MKGLPPAVPPSVEDGDEQMATGASPSSVRAKSTSSPPPFTVMTAAQKVSLIPLIILIIIM